MYQGIINYKTIPGLGGFNEKIIKDAEEKLLIGGTYAVHNSEFLTGANISVCLTKEFMEAVENDGEYELRFPDVRVTIVSKWTTTTSNGMKLAMCVNGKS